MIEWAPVITRRFLLCRLPRFAHVTPAAIQYAGNRMKMSLTLRLALLPGLIAAACLCWAASKPKPLTSYDPEAKALLRSEEHTSELQSLRHLVCRLLLEKKQNMSTGAGSFGPGVSPSGPPPAGRRW